MKLNLFALSALLALAAAADTTTAETSTTTVSAEVQCAKKCDAKDLCCIAECYKVPCPSENQANDTNSCVAACPQGSGSAADTKKYADCEQNCFNSHFFPATGAAAATNTASSGSSGTTASGSSATETGSSSSNSNKGVSSTSGSATGTSTGAVQSTGAAANVKLGASGAGLFGLVLAAFAL
ncbi:uncharacterized protein N7482_008050 [Penicillium canariense]|uniref:Uncharacterized protein n=1 Tax=Penicillium canariense TaxID=189055 RepID=A0A9W9HV80_9EURO|nr:uncharacterized protein N7482_008050 [Penicillium canariense]KAJ5156950.1 hypothetical protein N7482_008050 [Penicillium canariense]